MKKTTIGGQALIEGLLMMGPENAAIAVRKADGEIVVENRPLPAKSRVSKLPLIRGVVGFFRQMVLGVKALMYSAEFVELDEEKPQEEDKLKKPSGFQRFYEGLFGGRLKRFVDDKLGKLNGNKISDAAVYFSVIISLGFSIGLFVLLPNLIAGLLKFDKSTAAGVFYYNIFEGFIRITLFFGYIAMASLMKDIKRVWEYHGAEHKTIHCYEHGEELTVENIKKYSTKHPRCGTSFMFLVIVVSILVFSLLGWHSPLVNILLRLIFIPVVAGLSYEVLRFSGRSELKIMKVVSAPGMLFQLFTTKEPDESQIEVAIAAFNGVRIPNADSDKW